MASILLLGTFDTKADEYRHVAERLDALGCDTVTVDVGVLGPPGLRADVAREQVAAAAGTSIEELVRGGDRGAAVATMAAGAARIVRRLFEQDRFCAALALGGSGGAALASEAFRALPLGVPKLIVSTVAAGDTSPFVGDADLTLMYPVVDLAGVNSVSAQVLDNAAAAIAGMAAGRHKARSADPGGGPMVGLTMFGITTPCVDRVRTLLAEEGYQPLVFSANGVGGRSLERLVDEGHVKGVVDVTTTELADRLVGGILPAADGRLEGAGRRGLPQVVSVGALDVVNFGPWDTVPERFRSRKLHGHNPAVTLMRTSPEECAELGRLLAAKLAGGRGPRSIVLPLRGVSALSAPGGPFHDPEADEALFDALRTALPRAVDVIELDAHINEPEVADALAERFHAAFRVTPKESLAG
jgi:uncharacterized protein (UPF0261 family)